jgi:hypothetical protein
MYQQPMMQPYQQPIMQPYQQPMMQPYQQPMMQPVMQPVYMPPPQQQGPTIITINGNNGGNGAQCPTCGHETGNIPRKKVGCVAIAWGVCLLVATGWLCFLPCLMDGCKDTEIVCVKCNQVKSKVAANCC